MREVGRVAGHRRKPVPAFDRLLGSAKPALGQQRRGQPVLGGVTDSKAFGHAAKTSGQARGLRCGMAERPSRAPHVEPDQAGAGGRRPENPAGRRDMPAAPVMRRHHGEPDAARSLDPDNKRVQQFASGHRTQLGKCEEARCDRPGRVHHRSEMRVVVFEHIGAGGVQESGIKRVWPLAAPDHDRLRRPEERRQHRDGDVHRLVPRATERTADKVQQPAHAFTPHLRWDGVPL